MTDGPRADCHQHQILRVATATRRRPQYYPAPTVIDFTRPSPPRGPRDSFVATSSCLRQSAPTTQHCSHIFQPILIKLKSQNQERYPGYDLACKIWLMWDDGKGVCVGREFLVTFSVLSILFCILAHAYRLQVTPVDRSRPFMAQSACFCVRYPILWVSMLKNNVWGSKLPKNMIFGGQNRHFKPNLRNF